MWERAEGQGSRELRALMVLGVAHPEEGLASLSQLSIGQRDKRMLAVHERLSGRALALSADCARCEQPVEVALDARVLAATTSDLDATDEPPPRLHHLRHEDIVIDFHLPDTSDLDALTVFDDVETARQALIDRCVHSATAADGTSLRGHELAADRNAPMPTSANAAGLCAAAGHTACIAVPKR